MFGQMMNMPLLISEQIEFAARFHSTAEVVTRTVEGPVHHSSWGEVARRVRKLANALQAMGIKPGDELIVITWLHEGKRDVLQVHPRSNPNNPLTGVFNTRSPDRPNPLGLHPVTVREIEGNRLRVGPVEAIDGTPVVDIKPVLC